MTGDLVSLSWQGALMTTRCIHLPYTLAIPSIQFKSKGDPYDRELESVEDIVSLSYCIGSHLLVYVTSDGKLNSIPFKDETTIATLEGILYSRTCRQ